MHFCPFLENPLPGERRIYWNISSPVKGFRAIQKPLYSPPLLTSIFLPINIFPISLHQTLHLLPLLARRAASFFLQYALHPVKVQGGQLWATKNPFHPGHLMSFFLTSGFLSLFPFYNFFSFLRVDRARQPGMVACLGEGDPDFKPPVILRSDRFCKITPLLF